MKPFNMRRIEKILHIDEPMDKTPLAVVAAAVGIGYVLGGGLFTGLTARIVGVGLRFAAMAIIPRVQEEAVRRLLLSNESTETTAEKEYEHEASRPYGIEQG